MLTYTKQGYMDVDLAYQESNDDNRHHFHVYQGGMIAYKKEYIHLYKIK